jgi:predicted TIM-barrel fold metal-dependent hydrolase
LKAGLAAACLTQFANARPAAGAREKSGGLIDVNVHLSRWPARRLNCDDTPSLVSMLRRHGVTEAWAGSFDGLLHRNLTTVNGWLADECRRHGRGLLRPFGSVNPISPGWVEDLRRCLENYRMPGIRLHPNYHGYKLDHPNVAQLFEQASRAGLMIQIALVMEDERTMHPLSRVEPVDAAPLAGLVRQTPGLRLLLLNSLRTLRAKPLLDLIATGSVHVEISQLEGVGGISSLLAQASARRILFGSHAPLFYFDSAILKLKESLLTPEQREAITFANARRLLKQGR